MKSILRWFTRVIGSAVSVVLIIVLLPHASRLVSQLLPDATGATIKTSAVLASWLENTARLEVAAIEDEGVLSYDIQAALIGSVGSINVSYVYSASIGLDLKQVQMQANGNTLTFILPPVEVLSDALTPMEIFRDDFWIPNGIDDNALQKLLEEERIVRREAHLADDREALRDAAVSAFESTIAAWMSDLSSGVTFRYVFADDVP